MSARIRPSATAIAWVQGVATIVMMLVTVRLAVVSGYSLRELDHLLFVAGCAAVGNLIIAHQPRHLVGWLLAAGAICFVLLELTGQYALYGQITRPGSVPLAEALAWPQTWLWAPAGGSVFLLLPLYFPNGRLLSPRWRILAGAIVAAIVLAGTTSALLPGDEAIATRPSDGYIENPLGVQSLEPWMGVLNPVAPLISFSLLCAVTVGIFVRYRRSSGTERQQIKWLTFAMISLPVVLVTGIMLDLSYTGVGFILLSIPAAVGIAILQHDLYDIDLIINRTLVYGALTALVVGAYVLFVGVIGTLVLDENHLLLSVAATGIVAVLFQPARDRVQRAVNRLMYGERDEPYAVITLLGQRIEDTLTPDAVLPAIVDTVAQALKLPYVAITLGQHSPVIAAAVGTPVGDPVHLPLVYRNEPVGELILAPRRPGESFTQADRRLLDDLTRQAGIAAHAVRLSTELQQSRERLVTAREEERRRLRRDLHDGLGPALASMTLQAEAARDLLSTDPEQTDALLADVTAGLQEATTDIRRLVYGLRPPALDDLGLLPALRNHAARFGPGGPEITIVADEPLPVLPAAVEVAAYRIVQEALTNVIHHAGARSCTVMLRLTGGQLVVDVTDDGIGLPESIQGGVGLRSMRERAAELGGVCSIDALPAGGTHVAALLPLGTGE